MNKKHLFIIIAVSCLTAGCQKGGAPDHLQETESTTAISIQSTQESSSQTAGESVEKADYTKYLKKNWIRNTDVNFPENGGLSIVISSIKDGKIKGEISAVSSGPAYNMDSAGFEGTVDGDKA